MIYVGRGYVAIDHLLFIQMTKCMKRQKGKLPAAKHKVCLFFLEGVRKKSSLFVILLIVLVGDVEVTELVGALVRGNDTEPVAELVLLEELLGKVLEVTLGELLVGGDGDLGIITTDNGHLIGETTGAALDLDAIVEELLESRGIENLVTSGAGAVDDELVRDLLANLL